jgi:hypothetical protein
MNISRIFNAVCLFIAVCAVGYIYFNKKSDKPGEDQLLQKNIVAEATIIAKKTDKNGIQHTIVEETNNILPKNLMMNSRTGYDTAFVDSLLSVTDILKKEVMSLTKINQSISAKNLQASSVIDSLNRKKFEYNDKNLYLSYTPTSDSTKAGVFDYRFNQDLSFIQYNRKKWFLGADHIYMDISSNSPYSTVNGVKKYTVPSSADDFGIKATVKTILLPQTNTVGSGIQLRFRYKKLTATGSNMYFPATKKWVPVIGLEYDLLNY